MKCEICKKNMTMKDEYNLKDAYLVSISKCLQYSDNGSSTEDVNDFLMCKNCFKKHGKKILDELDALCVKPVVEEGN